MAYKKKIIIYRCYDELTEGERKLIRQAFKRDYLGQGFRERYQIDREAFRLLSRESRR